MRNKYSAKRCEADGFKFDSQAEYRRYLELKLLERAGHIWGLVVHPRRYPLVVNGETVGHYTPDFEYSQQNERGELEQITEDVKGFVARDWPLRRNVFQACYGRAIREIGRKKKKARRAI